MCLGKTVASHTGRPHGKAAGGVVVRRPLGAESQGSPSLGVDGRGCSATPVLSPERPQQWNAATVKGEKGRDRNEDTALTSLKHVFKIRYQMTSLINLNIQLNIYFFKTYFQWSKISTNNLENTRCHQDKGTQTAQRFIHKIIQTSMNKTIRNKTKFQNTGQTYKVTIHSLLYFITVPF